MKVKLYVEGGGDSKDLHTCCREGFHKLLVKAGFSRPMMPSIVVCGSRNSTYDDFKNSVANCGDDEYIILLVDSEDPIMSASGNSWQHLQTRDGWDRPNAIENEQAQLMVTCMETWIMADRETLQDKFGSKLHMSALFPVKNLETRLRHEVQGSLAHATRDCGKDRTYKKGKRSFDILAELNPSILIEHLPHFRCFVETLRRQLLRKS